MADRPGNPEKKPADCGAREGGTWKCPNLEEVGGGFESERYECPVCGEGFTLYYEDMA